MNIEQKIHEILMNNHDTLDNGGNVIYMNSFDKVSKEIKELIKLPNKKDMEESFLYENDTFIKKQGWNRAIDWMKNKAK